MEKRIDIKNKDRPYRKNIGFCFLYTYNLQNYEMSNNKIKIDSG